MAMAVVMVVPVVIHVSDQGLERSDMETGG
jgi:hypothetical protein